MTPAVSVVIPTYNRAHYLPQAIDSALQQTFTDLEVIVVDDGSTDCTQQVLQSYGDRIRHVWTPNGGIAHARNVGMQQARGRYLTFLDSDDLLYPYALELQVDLLRRFPAVPMVCAEVTGFDDHGFHDRYHLRKYHASAFRDASESYDSIYASSMPLADACVLPQALLCDEPGAGRRRLYVGNVFDTYLLRLVLCQNTAVLRREVLSEIGLRSEHVYNYEEYDYLLRLTRNHEVAFADVPVYKLRYHVEQISSTARRDGMFVWIRKQRALLRVTRRHAFADRAYYEARKAVLDRHLAHLYRATAIPMMLLGPGNAAGRPYRRYARFARLYLARSRAFGGPQVVLRAASWLPGPVRRPLVRLIEGLRKEGPGGLLHRGPAALAAAAQAVGRRVRQALPRRHGAPGRS